MYPTVKYYAGCLTVLLLAALLGCTTPAARHDAGVENANDRELVVLLHGLARSKIAMWKLASRLERAGFLVQRIGYKSITGTRDEILADIGRQIQMCCAGHNHAVHFVGHSLGGLFIRAYLQDNRVENLGRVVLIGTPNQGAEIIDKFRHKWWVQFLGPTALALGTDDNSFPNSLKLPYYAVGVIAGVSDSDNEDILPGLDDGLISVESTKIESAMTDFTIIETGHSAMRYNSEVAKQTVAFLKNGRFTRETEPEL